MHISDVSNNYLLLLIQYVTSQTNLWFSSRNWRIIFFLTEGWCFHFQPAPPTATVKKECFTTQKSESTILISVEKKKNLS